MSTIRKRNHFLIFDFEYEESWLNDLASEGLLLTGAGIRGYKFEKSDNTDRRYRVIPKGNKDISSEELQLYRDEGWNTVHATQDKTIFYTDDPDSAEILTDRESYLDYLSRARRKFLGISILYLLVTALWVVNLIINLPGNQPSLLALSEKSMISEISYIVFLICFIPEYAIQSIGFWSCRKRMLQYSGAPVRLRYKSRLTMVKAVSCILLVIVIVACIGIFGHSSQVKGDSLMSYNEPYPVLLRKLAPDEWEFVSSHMEKLSWDEQKDVRYSCELYSASNLALKKGCMEDIYWSESTNYSDGELPQYTSLTYDFRSENMAERMLARQIAADMNSGRGSKDVAAGMDNIAIEVPGIDYAGFYETRSGGADCQYLYLRKGNVVVYSSYSGKHDLKKSIELYADQLDLSGEYHYGVQQDVPDHDAIGSYDVAEI